MNFPPNHTIKQKVPTLAQHNLTLVKQSKREKKNIMNKYWINHRM